MCPLNADSSRSKGFKLPTLLTEKLQWKALQLQITSLQKCYSFQHLPNTQDTQKLNFVNTV